MAFVAKVISASSNQAVLRYIMEGNEHGVAKNDMVKTLLDKGMDQQTIGHYGLGNRAAAVSGVNVDPDTAMEEFEYVQRVAGTDNGKSEGWHIIMTASKDDVDITDPKAIAQYNEFTRTVFETTIANFKGNYQAVVATQIDNPQHVAHSHISMNRTSLDDGKKFNQEHGMTELYDTLVKVHDELAPQYGYSVMNKQSLTNQAKMDAVRSKPDKYGKRVYRDEIQSAIDEVRQFAKDEDQFIYELSLYGIAVEDRKKNQNWRFNMMQDDGKLFHINDSRYGTDYEKGTILNDIRELTEQRIAQRDAEQQSTTIDNSIANGIARNDQNEAANNKNIGTTNERSGISNGRTSGISSRTESSTNNTNSTTGSGDETSDNEGNDEYGSEEVATNIAAITDGFATAVANTGWSTTNDRNGSDESVAESSRREQGVGSEAGRNQSPVRRRDASEQGTDGINPTPSRRRRSERVSIDGYKQVSLFADLRDRVTAQLQQLQQGLLERIRQQRAKKLAEEEQARKDVEALEAEQAAQTAANEAQMADDAEDAQNGSQGVSERSAGSDGSSTGTDGSGVAGAAKKPVMTDKQKNMMIRLDDLAQQAVHNGEKSFTSMNDFDFIEKNRKLYDALVKKHQEEKKQARQAQHTQQRGAADDGWEV